MESDIHSITYQYKIMMKNWRFLNGEIEQKAIIIS